jgi:predicted PurR-regulated permease PerM
MEHKSFLILVALVTVAFFWVLLPFYGAVFWAVILAIVFHPLERALENRFGPRSNVAALLCVLVCIVIAVIPVAVILASMLSEGAKLLQRIQGGEFDTSTLILDLQAQLPGWARDFLDRSGIGDLEAIRDRAVRVIQQLGQIVAGQALSLGQNTLRFVASVGIMLYVLFFLFRDGRRVIVPAIRVCMPLSDRYTRELAAKFAAVVRATVKGIVWLPVAVYFFLVGEVWKGAILVAVGGGVIGLVDNLLRPMLVGRDTRLPDYLILVSTVGGLSLFGINGFVIGPLIAALFVAVWAIYRDQKDPVRRAKLLRPEP